MTRQAREPITILLNELLDSAGLTDSFMGQIAKGIITKTLSKYTEASKERNLRADTPSWTRFSKLSEKWNKRILSDLSKLDISENEKKLLVALFLASLVSQVMTTESTVSETDIAKE